MRRPFVLLLSVLLLFLAACPAHAQEQAFAVYIARPGEGETFYTGPTSFLYRTNISGWVTGYGSSPERVEVFLEILQGNQLLGTQVTQLQSRGTFNFYITVNPDSPQEVFPPEQGTCAYTCHTPSKLGLPAGDMLVRVIVTLPDGRQAVDERRVAVDRAEYLEMPVQVVHAEDQQLITSGIPVKASTWLYMWRARLFSGATDPQGLAVLNVEVLSRAPTRYLFQVEPAIVDGVFYQSTEAVEAILSPGTRNPPNITLTVTSQTGRISGTLIQNEEAFQKALSVKAVRLPDGASFETVSGVDGTFDFADLPIGRYFVTVDNTALLLESRHAQAQEVDLARDIHTIIKMPVAPITSFRQGTVLTDEDSLLPFAWITPEISGQTQSVQPKDGSFTIFEDAHRQGPWTVSAPGYYSQAFTADPGGGAAPGLDIRLERQPDTKIVPWGNGELTLPAGAEIEIAEDTLYITRGWVWGRSGDSRVLTIQTGTTVISLNQARFALEVLPNQREWLFIMEGQATLYAPNKPDTITMTAGEMINLADGRMRWPAAYDPAVLAALRQEPGSPIAPVWKPTLTDRVRALVTRIGVGSAQIITISTYVLGIFSIFVTPIAAFVWWRRGRDRNPPSQKP